MREHKNSTLPADSSLKDMFKRGLSSFCPSFGSTLLFSPLRQQNKSKATTRTTPKPAATIPAIMTVWSSSCFFGGRDLEEARGGGGERTTDGVGKSGTSVWSGGGSGASTGGWRSRDGDLAGVRLGDLAGARPGDFSGERLGDLAGA